MYATSQIFLQNNNNQFCYKLILQHNHIKNKMIPTYFSQVYPLYDQQSYCPILYYSQNIYYEQIVESYKNLEKEITYLKQQSNNMIKKIEELAFQVHQQKRNQKNRVVKIKKNFKKDKICGHQNCCKRYSSRIALNAHVRKFHTKQQDSQEYVV